MSDQKVVVLFSGGMDSTTLLAKALSEGYEVHALTVMYGSKHNVYESCAVESIVDVFTRGPFNLASHTILDLTSVGKQLKSSLLLTGGTIPEGHYEEESMRSTVVPGRNLLFIAAAAAIAESRGCHSVWIGAHSGDHFIYADCRQGFVDAADRVVRASSDHKISVDAPYLEYDKTEILKEGKELLVPYHMTRTCYKNQLAACGRCGSCQERLEAFAANNVQDPISYENREIFPKKG